MALTANQLVVGMMNMAVGGYNTLVTDYMAANGDIASANALLGVAGLSTPALGGDLVSNSSFATTLVGRVLSGATSTVQADVATLVVNYMTTTGKSRGEVAVELITLTLNAGASHPLLGAASTAFAAKVASADAYTGTSTVVSELTTVVGGNSGGNTPTGNQSGTSGDDSINLLGGLASTIKIEGGQQGAAGDTLVITAEASATANIISLAAYADQNLTLDTEGRKVSPIVQGFENVDATAATTEMNITGRDRTSEGNTGSVASTQTGSVISGGNYRDTLTGGAGADSISGSLGNDVITGNAGADSLSGGANDDNIMGGAGADVITDGTGNDTVTGGDDADTITIGGGLDNISGDAGNDSISFATGAVAGTSTTARTTVSGGAGADTINNTNATSASFVTESGGAGNDTFTLGVATETINAGADNDILVIQQSNLGNTDILNGNDGQDALQLLLTSGDATTTFVLNPVSGFAGFEVIELIDQSGNTNAKTYKVNLTDNFVANNLATGRFLIDARGLSAGSNLVIDTSALTAASAASFTAGNFQVWTSPSTDIRDQLNKTITSTYAMNSSNAALSATTAFYTNSADTTNKAGVHDATTGLITTAPSGAAAYTTTGGTVEGAVVGTTTGGNTFTLTAANAILTTTTSANVTPATSFLTTGADTITAGGNLSNAFITDASSGDGDVLTAAISGGAITAPTITNIETINLTTNQTAASSLVGISGATAINISGGTSSFTEAQSKALALSSGYAAGMTANVTTVASQGLTVTLNGTAAGAGITTNSQSIYVASPANPHALSLAVAANSTLSTLDMGAATATINVTGAGNLTVTDTTLTGTLTAATMTGTLTANMSAGIITGSSQADVFAQTVAGNASVNGGAGNDSFTFDTTGTLTILDTINGGDGTDTITTTGWTATTNLDATTNVEVLNVNGASIAADYNTLDALVAFGQTLTVTGAAATGTSTLRFNGAAETNGVFNVTGTLGADTIIGGANGDTISGGAGVDQLTGGAGADTLTTGTGADVINFGVAGDTDTVTDFTVAAAGDIIDVSAAGNTALGALVGQIAEGSAAAVAHADNTVLFISVATYAALDTKAEIAALFAAGQEFAAVVQDDENTLLVSAADTGKTYVWSLTEENANTSLAEAGDAVLLVGILDGVTAALAATMVAANFQA